MDIDRGYISPQFVNNQERLLCQYDNARVLVTDQKVCTDMHWLARPTACRPNPVRHHICMACVQQGPGFRSCRCSCARTCEDAAGGADAGSRFQIVHGCSRVQVSDSPHAGGGEHTHPAPCVQQGPGLRSCRCSCARTREDAAGGADARLVLAWTTT